MSIEQYSEERPWGGFTQFIHNTPATVKILRVKSGEAVGERTERAKAGDEFTVGVKEEHRIRGITDVEVLEIGLGDFDENDIIRLEDKYGRK
jgi:mannose-6-phosphate isomerase